MMIFYDVKRVNNRPILVDGNLLKIQMGAVERRHACVTKVLWQKTKSENNYLIVNTENIREN